MISNASVAKKLTVGFGLVLFALLVVVATSYLTMESAAERSHVLTDEYIPELDMATQLRGATNRMMYNMRGYSYSEDPSYLAEARSELALLDQTLVELNTLSSTSHSLVKLPPALEAISQARDSYVSLVNRTEASIAQMDEARSILDQSAAAYMQQCNDFVSGQITAFQQDLDERIRKIKAADKIQDIATQARVNNFRGQAEENLDLLVEASDVLDELPATISSIKSITRSQTDLDALTAIQRNGSAYQQAINDLLPFVGSEDDTSEIIARMDTSAKAYVTAVEAFAAGQKQALTQNMQERMQKGKSGQSNPLHHQIRIGVFKAQALREPQQLEEAPEVIFRISVTYFQLSSPLLANKST